ncbi:phenylalanine--tRNA ligase subunit beta [Pseudobutyrivibrio ruminis]|uniref:Phenylalanine--tRNA ligase beta subunit n=1 Tax=Pseudobutyrivibrio ruminis DSM 9787 TaxID=1123011 RepID=A0A285RSC5_9FIRM|nr:phenylalanine--tRNA ligase subunit beta [Pseudobutyrivibrio ruminis]SOB97101.1 phenylalanyl-tRNA synthetase beta subunit [Pseudobutyrivibrio ruminis DSM 9787]
MFISMNWISDFVDLEGLDKMELISKFSLATAEVENDIFHKGEDLSGVVVAEIKSVEEHPESKKLHLLKVDAGDGKLTDVVCGAPNVRVGMKTAFAKVGAQIGDITIAPRPLAGYDSFGMCCSEKEIGISDNNDGIMDILDDAPNGTDIKDLYEIDDIIFEVDNKSLTNRPDLWGHYGIAREFATIAKRPLKELPTLDLSKYDNLEKIDLKIEDELCQRYSSLKVENINTNVAPVNMRIRLFYCGMRAINLLADLTNYIMLEMGQPMHAFDSRKVEKIRIKRFDKPFTFTTLDGIERNIDENTLMICNDNTPVAIAGIMGGLDSEIVEDTTTLTLESATFNAASIRKSAVRLSHRTDASARYEKSLDPEMTTVAIARFMKLLSDIDDGVKVVSALTDEYAFHYPQVSLDFDKDFVDKYTGIEISDEHIVDTLTSLGFGVSQDGANFHVEVPSYRATKDISLKADIIEEITRIYGYDNFELSTTNAPLYPVRMAEDKNVEDRIKDILVKRFQLHEVHSYVWQYADEYKKLGMEVEENIKLANSTNPNIETLRRSIIPTQLCQVNYNTGYATDFGIFEVGRVVEGLKEDGLCDEHKKLCITLFSKTKSLETLYFELRDMIAETIADVRHKSLTYKKLEATHSYEHPKNLYSLVLDDVVIGEMGVAHPLVSKKIDKKAAIVFAEIDVEALADIKQENISYVEPSKYPSIEVDLSFVAEKFSEINDTIKESAQDILKKVGVADVYSDSTGKSITVRLLFGDDERTLTHDEVQKVVDDIIEKLKNKGINLKM